MFFMDFAKKTSMSRQTTPQTVPQEAVPAAAAPGQTSQLVPVVDENATETTPLLRRLDSNRQHPREIAKHIKDRGREFF